MSNFFAKIFKSKKTLFFVLFFAVLFFVIPQTASAGLFSWATNAVANAILSGLLGYLFWFPMLIALLFVTVSNVLLQAAIAFATIGTSYTHSDAVNIGWPIVRDLANMMVVLGFVLIGLATTLRIKEYEAKQLLLKLIIAALLINFSLLICGIFIDGSNIVMKYFFKTNNLWAGWFPGISDLWNILTNIGTDNVLNYAAKIFGLIFFWIAAGFVNILYFFLLLMRVLALWMLVILSPLAFVCYVFPFTKGIFQMWWKNFFQWCIIILPAGLFYYIGSTLVHNSFSSHGALDLASPSTYVEYISNALSIILIPSLFLIAGFFVSLQFSAMGASAITGFANKHKGTALKMGAGVLGKSAGNASKLANWASNKAGGNTSRVGRMFGAASNAFGNSQARTDQFAGALKKTKSAFGRALEGAGAMPVGTQAGKDDKVLADAVKQLAAALRSGNKKDEQRVFDNIHNGVGMNKTAAISASVSTGKLHDAFKNTSGDVQYSKMNDALLEAEKSGAPKDMRKDAQDKYYQLAGFNDKNVDSALTGLGHKAAIDTQLTADGITPGTASPAQRMAAARKTLGGMDISRAEEKANYIKLGQNWSSMDLEAKANTDLGGLHPDDLKEFTLSRNAEDIKAFKLLDKGHDNIATQAPKMLARVIAELATPGISTNRQRRLTEVKDELEKL